MNPGSNELRTYHPPLPSVGTGGSAGPVREREGLIDVLDRVLDKGVVIAGDIRINLLDIELLTIKVRLLISSADKARELGIDWWSHDPHLSSGAKGQKKLDGDREKENKQLKERVEKLEAQLKALTDRSGSGGSGTGTRAGSMTNGGSARRNG
jgi:hypothetical protein